MSAQSIQPFATKFQTMNSARSIYLQSLKYQRFTPSGCKKIGIRKILVFVMAQYKLKAKNVLWNDLSKEYEKTSFLALNQTFFFK